MQPPALTVVVELRRDEHGHLAAHVRSVQPARDYGDTDLQSLPMLLAALVEDAGPAV